MGDVSGWAYFSSERLDARNSSTAPASLSHSASPIGSDRVIMPRRASQMPCASMSKKNSSFSFWSALAASAGVRTGAARRCARPASSRCR